MTKDKPFVVSDRIRELAKEHGWPDPDKEVDAFVDHYEASNWVRKGGVKIINKDAAFRTWLRTAARWKSPAARPQPKREEVHREELTPEQRQENIRKVREIIDGIGKKGIR